ncbi:MAG: hypothetical protein NZ740_08100 [Kiritimatiellae bacterium]|nr:hypothetical protein [Kiritimatiellia bacterium]MDW8459055.1 hypothetical protein [Verrucomicrobiota bacterium]
MICMGVLNSAAQEADLSSVFKAIGAMQSAQTNEAVQVADFRAMRALLPNSIGGYKRKESGGEKTSFMGITTSYAEGRYEQGEARMTVKMTDYGGTGLAGMLAAAWTMSEVDRETETGFERTVDISGHRALEKFDHSARSGELKILVADRYMVEISVYGGKPEDLRSAAEAIPVQKLAELK